MSGYPFLIFVIYGLLFTGILLLTAFLAKVTGGLFWSRTLKDYWEDLNSPYYQQEQEIGSNYSHLILKYVPPFFIAFLIIFVWFNR
ncbi:hypothetical protein [Enterococcus rivorum]|uniref:Uncharacterized protein n=1 Tax=Enterococcus rivorum TaxID=762845 RepID=A0A1E5KYN5_9ENTE|nr:hypothetical protein [Enterococcus rivorum]MBP2097532.1 hypothetical protein [Enterococcus rivorum]OEH82986.1 hypothetical protein BCR26_01560 [Enterococcus rivorum]